MKILDTQYLIIGAGLAGTALAFLLRRSGSEVSADGASSKLRRLLTGKRPIIIPGLQAQVPPQELIAAYLPEMFDGKVDCSCCWYIPQKKLLW